MNKGFSLVELSIVLVILGLLVGGILTGQNLIRAAEIRAISTEFQQYQTAINLFEEKYFALPGDMANATQFWGRADNGTFSDQCAAPAADTGTGTQTCNGDGDGWVGLDSEPYERFRFWQHLANAGLVEGTFTGVTAVGSNSNAVIRENVPPSKIGSAGWMPWSVLSWDSLTAVEQGRYFTTIGGQYFFLGAKKPNWYTENPFLTNAEAWSVDKKLDDGMPATGNVTQRTNSFISTCASSDALDAQYQLDMDGVGCLLLIRFK